MSIDLNHVYYIVKLRTGFIHVNYKGLQQHLKNERRWKKTISYDLNHVYYVVKLDKTCLQPQKATFNIRKAMYSAESQLFCSKHGKKNGDKLSKAVQ